MWKEYQKKWKHNFSKSAGDRTGLRALMFIVYLFVANLGISAAWFIPLLIFAKLVVELGLMSAQLVALVSIVVTQIVALIQFIASFSEFGERLLAKIAEKLDEAIIQAFLPTGNISFLPAATRIADHQFPYSRYLPAPYTPPRTYLS